VLRAFASVTSLRRHELVIVGDGPMRTELERTVEAEGLTSCVRLMGWKAQAEIAKIMIGADVFVFPSIRELGAGVVLEAMACSCVPVVVDYGGPAELVTAGSGVKIPLASKRVLTERFAKALEALSNDHVRRVTLGESAAKRASTYFTWDAKAEKLSEVYEWVTGRLTQRPDFEERGPAERE
jgi:glycosyltransferase involved in cell wall biosynthesis